MEPYEVKVEDAIKWANDYASFKELESVAKAIYSIYKIRQKEDKPDEYEKNRGFKRTKDFNVQKKAKPVKADNYWRYKKGKSPVDENADRNGPVKVVVPANRKP